jgi:hypothetical protein
MELCEALAQALQLPRVQELVRLPDASCQELAHLRAQGIGPHQRSRRQSGARGALVDPALARALDTGPLADRAIDSQHEPAARGIDPPALIDAAAAEALESERRGAGFKPGYERQRRDRRRRICYGVHGCCRR